jgi:murein DD-endopeptidase MepM/ murein hydrolase activator NlpD
MKRRRLQRRAPLLPLFLAFCVGMIVSWGLHHYGPPMPNGEARHAEALDSTSERRRETAAGPESAPTSARVVSPVKPAPSTDTPAVPIPTTGHISAPPLRMPLDHVNVEAMKGGFQEHRGSRPHEAADLLAPRNTPVHAVENGTVAKLFVSKAGGLTIYQFDPSGQLCYYYAHLERYADGLREGQPVSAGQVIGYVGTSGNAPPNTPHLHFAVFELSGDRQWWKGRAVDPYPLFKSRVES